MTNDFPETMYFCAFNVDKNSVFYRQDNYLPILEQSQARLLKYYVCGNEVVELDEYEIMNEYDLADSPRIMVNVTQYTGPANMHIIKKDEFQNYFTVDS